MIIALLLQLTVVQPRPQDVWASLSFGASLAHTSETVDFLDDGTDTVDGEVILRRTSRRLNNPPKVMWATSRTCAGVRDAVARFDAIPMPTVVRPWEPEFIVLDGEGFSVRFNGRYGSGMSQPIQFNSKGGTALSKWVSGTFSVLEPCWSEKRPS